MSRILILMGVILVIAGLLWELVAKIPFLGRLPGDILIQKKNVTFYFPLATSLLISVLLSLFLWFFSRK